MNRFEFALTYKSLACIPFSLPFECWPHFDWLDLRLPLLKSSQSNCVPRAACFCAQPSPAKRKVTLVTTMITVQYAWMTIECDGKKNLL